MGSSNLLVPLVIWGNRAPTHCISSLLMTPDQSHLITGCNDGQICVWDVDASWQVQPRTMLFGHTAAITCLAMGSNQPDKNYLVSSSDSGEMCLWDLTDGRCIEHTKMSITHTSMQAYQMMYCKDVRLVCNGYYPDIHIIHPHTLEIVFSLSSRLQADWISALCVLRPIKREDDVVIAMSNSGTVKVWTLSVTEGHVARPIYEDESKQLRCLNAQTLHCCAYNQRTVLIVCSKYWQIYDAGDFSLLCSESSRRGERWSGGEFIDIDRIVVWSNDGKGYLYKLPTNLSVDSSSPCNPGDPRHPCQLGPKAYMVLDVQTQAVLECCPTMTYFLGVREQESRLLLRGDSEGRVVIWTIPVVKDTKLKLARQESVDKLPVVKPVCSVTLQNAWEATQPPPEGITDHMNMDDEKHLTITATIYVPTYAKLVCGRDDGSIVIVPVVQSIILQLLDNGHDKDSLPHQTLQGHSGQVNCLLYPYSENARYNQSHLVSGSIDFTVCLWDILNGERLHVFSVQGGEITQLTVPPSDCNSRILSCVCSVATDHSVALLSLKEKKCILHASRHLFPVQTVKWRPLDDFLVIHCTDGTVYVWQIETGHLDRVAHGVIADEILEACDDVHSDEDDHMTNPTISIAQALRRRNLATFRNLAQQHLKKTSDSEGGGQGKSCAPHPSLVHHPQALPMTIQGLQTNFKDPHSHIVYFDIETLIVQLLSEEYSLMSPSTLENLGFFVREGENGQEGLSETQKKMSEFFAKVKDHAENIGQKIQEKAEEAGLHPLTPPTPRRSPQPDAKSGKTPPPRPKPPRLKNIDVNHQTYTRASHVMDIAQLFMSCIHAWGLDPDLDKLGTSKLGLLRPKRPISFGLLSRGGHMSLLLPGWYKQIAAVNGNDHQMAVMSAVSSHWQISTAITTQHLLSVISVANTLMSMTNASFKCARTGTSPSQDQHAEGDAGGATDTVRQAQTKQGWSLLAALHCVLLPDLIGRDHYRPPQLEILARRWQDRCLEIREAAQALLLAELQRIGPEGRKQVVDSWASYVDPAVSLIGDNQPPKLAPTTTLPPELYDDSKDEDEDVMLGGSESPMQHASLSFENRRKQATAIVMMGVLGAEFGAEIEPSRGKVTDERRKKSVVEGFGLTNYSHARHTSKALSFLLLQPPTERLQANTPIRRAAVDLIGRGFTVWEPYLDVSAVLLGMLELCVDGDKLVPSMTFGLPLCPTADSCRSARHALSLIATARPATFITTMAKEVARYNAVVGQTSQAQGLQLANSPLIRAKSEILRTIELLIEKIPNEIVDLMVEVMDITIHCIDQTAVKTRGLQDVFPALFKFSTVSFCSITKRACVGAKNGGVAFYELKQAKSQMLPAHKGPVSAVAFSPHGKFLASFSFHDNHLLFWQTASSSLFGIGSQPTKCVKTYTTPPVVFPPNTSPIKMVKLVWVDARTVVLLSADGSESRYRI